MHSWQFLDIETLKNRRIVIFHFASEKDFHENNNTDAIHYGTNFNRSFRTRENNFKIQRIHVRRFFL